MQIHNLLTRLMQVMQLEAELSRTVTCALLSCMADVTGRAQCSTSDFSMLFRWKRADRLSGMHLGTVQQLSAAFGSRLPLCDEGAQNLHSSATS